MKQHCLVILLFTCSICVAQNFVPNGGFEQFTSCPNNCCQINLASNWLTPTTNIWGVSGTPDYFNQCAAPGGVSVPNNFPGYQYANSGDAYCGLGVWVTNQLYREYIEVPLTSTLISNLCYHFEMSVNLANFSKYTTEDIGVYFSDTLVSGINNYLPLPFVAQINNATGNVFDTLNWVLVTGDYTASGGENYLIIGNFKDDANTDTVLINNNAVSTFLYLYIDDVSLVQVIPCNTGIEVLTDYSSVNIFPNPVNNKLNITTNNQELSEIILYDITSRKMLQQQFTNSVSLNTEQLAMGLYLYEVRNKDGSCKKGKIVKD